MLSPDGVLDRDALVRLGEDVQDHGFALSFAQRYRAMLSGRVERLVAALAQGDLVDAMDAVLSLKVSSITMGTRELAGLAISVEQEVRRRDVTAACSRAAHLRSAATRAESALDDYLASYRPR